MMDLDLDPDIVTGPGPTISVMPQHLGVVEIEDLAAFDAVVLAAAVPVLVEFGAPWCGPCRALAPVLEEIAAERAGTLVVAAVDLDRLRDFARRYRIWSVPTMIVFTGGAAVGRIRGGRGRAAITRRLDRLLG
jgi:thioredoxin 1